MLGKDLTRKRFFQRLKRAAQARADMATRDSSESEGTIDETPEESEADTDAHLSSRQGLPPTFSLQSESVLSWNPHIFQSLGRHGGDTIFPKDLDEIALEVELKEEKKMTQMMRRQTLYMSMRCGGK